MKIFRSTLSVLALAGLVAMTPAQANESEELDGLLVGGRSHSAIVVISPESGDLIMYYFANQSRAGREILKGCVPEMFCSIQKSKVKEIEAEPGKVDFDIPYGPSVMFEITAASEASISTDGYEYEKSMSTRFGEISVDEENMLRFKGRRVQPEVQGNSSLSLSAVFELPRQDVVLVQNTGGTACPALFQFATVNADGVQVSPEFGTCSDYFRVYQREDGGIVFYTVQADEASRGKSPRLRRVDYLFHKGVLTENGKVVKP